MLILDAALILVHPLPDTLQEGLASDFMSVGPFFCQGTFHHRLGGDASMVLTGNPEGLITLHAMVADHNILDCRGDGMAEVQCSRHIGRRHTDHKRFTRWIRTRLEVAALFPKAI